MHNHQSEVVSEGISDEIPRARQVLEPDLRFAGATTVHQCKSTIPYLRINIEASHIATIICTPAALVIFVLGAVVVRTNLRELILVLLNAFNVSQLVQVHDT